MPVSRNRGHLSSRLSRYPGFISPPSVNERPYGGRTAAQRRAQRRAELLDAGLQLFGTTGFAATTIEALCAAAGLNPRYFYEQFSSREELLRAVYDRQVEAVLQTVNEAVLAAPAEAVARLQAGLSAFVRSTLADERAARINYFEIVGVSSELDGRRRAVLRSYAELIAAQAAELGDPGVLGLGDRRMAAVALVGATDALVIDSLSGGAGVSERKIVETILRIFLR